MKLKFKAWDRQVNRMTDVTRLEFDHNGNLSAIAVDNYAKGYGMFKMNDVEARFELLQYTGLNDVDGKEIYQGYVLQRRSGEYYTVAFNRLENGATSYSTAFYLQSVDGAHTPMTFEPGDRIVGNIFDNADLINQDSSQDRLMTRVKNRLTNGNETDDSTEK